MPRNKKLILNSVDKMLPESAPLQNEDNVHNGVDLPSVSVSCSTSTAADYPTTVQDTDFTTLFVQLNPAMLFMNILQKIRCIEGGTVVTL